MKIQDTFSLVKRLACYTVVIDDVPSFQEVKKQSPSHSHECGLLCSGVTPLYVTVASNFFVELHDKTKCQFIRMDGVEFYANPASQSVIVGGRTLKCRHVNDREKSTGVGVC